MFSGPPLPLPPEIPLGRLARYVDPPDVLGAWRTGSTQELRLRSPVGGRILASADLGLLLSRCNRVALREGREPVVLETTLLIQWRVLQVVTGTPYLPGLERVRAWFPDIALTPHGFRVPIRTQSPEAVLAECLAHHIEIAESRVVYRAPAPGGGSDRSTAEMS